MLRRFDDVMRKLRSRRARDEHGSAMLLVVTIVLVGFMISAGISAASLASVTQTTNARSQVQALAAAEAGRDTVAAYLKKTVPTCAAADMSGTIPGSGGSWSVKMYYKVGANLTPSGFDAAGAPQGGGWSAPALCVDMAAADFDPGLYTIVLASTGTAPDGTQRVISSVYPFRVERPNDSIVAPNVGPFTLKGALGGNLGNVAHTGDLIVKGDFTCGTGSEITVIKGDVYVLAGNADFRWPGCFITGDLYVAGNVDVSGDSGVLPAQPAFEKSVFPAEPKTFGYGDNGWAQGRILWVGGNARVGGNLAEENGLTVRGSILAGGNVTLRCGLTKGLGEANVGADLAANQVAIHSGGKVSLLNNSVNDCGTSSDPIKGHVRAVTAVEMGSSDRGLGQGAWKITGNVQAGTTASISGSDVTGTVTAPGSVTMDSSDTGPVTAGTTATLTGSSAGLVKANNAVSVSNSSARDVTVSGVTAGGPVTVTRSGLLAGRLTVDGDVKTAAGDLTFTRSGTIGGDLVVTGTASTRSGNVSVTRGGSLGGDLFINGDVATGSGSATVRREGSGGGSLFMKGVSANGRITLAREDGAGGRLRLDGAVTAHGPVAISRSGALGGNLEIVGPVSTDLGAVTITRSGSDAADLLMEGDVSANGPVTIAREGGAGHLSLTGAIRAKGDVAVIRSGALGGNLYITNGVITDPGKVTITRQGDGIGGVSIAGDVRAKGDVSLERNGAGSLVGGAAYLIVRGVEATGNVTQTDASVQRCVKTNGSYTGTPTSDFYGVSVGKCVHARGAVTLSAGIDWLTYEAAVGDDTVSPAIWSGTSVKLNSLGGTGLLNYGVVSSNVYAPSISTTNVWNVNGSKTTGTNLPGVVADPSVPLSSIPVPTPVPPLDPTPPVSPLPAVPVGPTAAQLTTLADGVTVLDAGHWMDLSYSAVRDAALSSGYETTYEGQPLTFTGSDCKDGGLFGLGWSKAAEALGKVIKAGPDTGPAPKYLVDTTACTDPLNAKFAVALKINSDVVVLVKNFKNQLTSTLFGGTSGTAAAPRSLFFIQPDSTPDFKPTCNNGTDAAPSDRNKNKRPDEQSGRSGFDFDSAYGTEKVSTMYYTPCGFGGVITPPAASSRFYGQLFLGRQSSGIWNEFHCQPMQLGDPRALNLTCGEPMTAADVAGTGGSKAYTLESDTPIFQTEPVG